jgi:hypothetical protein
LLWKILWIRSLGNIHIRRESLKESPFDQQEHHVENEERSWVHHTLL